MIAVSCRNSPALFPLLCASDELIASIFAISLWALESLVGMEMLKIASGMYVCGRVALA